MEASGPKSAGLSNEDSTFSGFDKVMREFASQLQCLADEHAREVAELQNVIARMSHEVSDSKAKAGHFSSSTNVEDEGHLSPVASERRPQDSPENSDDIEYSTDGERCEIFPNRGDGEMIEWPSNQPVTVYSSEVSENDSLDHELQEFGSLDHELQAFGSLPVDHSESSLGFNLITSQSSQLRPSLRSSRRSSTSMRSSKRSQSTSMRNSMRSSRRSSMSVASSVKRALSSTFAATFTTTKTSVEGPANSMDSIGAGESQLSMESDGSFTNTEKQERRRERLRMTLKARLRSTWELTRDSAELVPRWSQGSGVSNGSESIEDRLSVGKAVSEKRKMGLLPLTTSSLGWVFSPSTRNTKCCFADNFCVIHPQSRFKVAIDILGVLMMGYDFIMTPLTFFELSPSDFTIWMGWATRIFWTVDMWLNFHVATYNKGVLDTRFQVIARHYIKTMFILDVLIVGVEWTVYILEESGSFSKSFENVSLLRALKGLRFAKVMRLLKFERIMQEFKAQINSMIVLLCLRPLILVFFLLVLNHTIACVWYGIGTSHNGWVELETKDSSFWYMYFTSLHWAVTQLHGNMEIFPQNLSERVFMCTMSIIALLLYSTFLSSITNGMMQLHALRSARHDRTTRLRAVLARRNISTELSTKINKRMDYLDTAKADVEGEMSTLGSLPTDLLTDLYEESRKPVVLGHGFFQTLDVHGPRILRRLCHDAMSEASYLPDEKIFSIGDACSSMIFVINGVLIYQKNGMGFKGRGPSVSGTNSNQIAASESYSAGMNGSDATNLTPSMSNRSTMGAVSTDSYRNRRRHEDILLYVLNGFWVSEAALWMTWEYCGNLYSRSPAVLLSVDAISFAAVLSNFHFAHVNSSRYARHFLDRMVDCGMRTDVILAEENDD